MSHPDQTTDSESVDLRAALHFTAQADRDNSICFGDGMRGSNLRGKLTASQQQEAFAAAFRGQLTSEGNTQVLIPVRELALCGAPHKANAECVFMKSAAA